jgi:hypothetical protein
MSANDIPNLELTGQVLLYNQPEPLNPTTHGNLGIKAIDAPFAFLAKTHVVPVAVNEFAAAALSYPIIFAGEAKSPLAVMGLNPGQNLSVMDDGNFDPLAYIPAYVRRYPFVFAADESTQRMIVCVEKGAAIVSDKPDVPFFENGQPTAYTQQSIEFLQEFERARQMSEAFCKMITELDLWEHRKQTFTPPPTGPGTTQGKPIPLADYFAISSDKLSKLAPAKLKELHDNGALAAIYAHLTSLIGWDRLVVKAAIRDGAMKKN